MYTDEEHYEIEVKFKFWMSKREMDEVQTKVQELLRELQKTAGSFHIEPNMVVHLAYNMVNIKKDEKWNLKVV